MILRMRTCSFAILMTALAAIGLLASGPAQAQAYPERPIRLIVPFPAGGATDTMARLVAQGLQAKLGQNVVIENPGGAGGTIGTRQAAFAAADGYTLLITAATAPRQRAPLLYKLDYDPVKAVRSGRDRRHRPAGDGGRRHRLPINTVQELVAIRQGQSGQARTTARRSGSARISSWSCSRSRAGTDIVHVPYRGGAPMITDLLRRPNPDDGQRQVGAAAAYPGRQDARARRHRRRRAWPGCPGCRRWWRLGYLRCALRHACSAWWRRPARRPRSSTGSTAPSPMACDRRRAGEL